MVDDAVAERIARERLATSLSRDAVPYASQLALLNQHCRQISRALAEGEEPSADDVTTALLALDGLRGDLDDVEALFWPDNGRECPRLERR